MMRLKIFVVDDDPFFSLLLQTHLNTKMAKDDGEFSDFYEVVSFTSSQECMDALDQAPVMIVADYDLGVEINGVQLILKAQQINPDINCVLMSSNKDNKQKGALEGVDRFVLKDDECVHSIEDLLMEEIEVGDVLDMKSKSYIQELSVLAGVVIGILVGITIYVS